MAAIELQVTNSRVAFSGRRCFMHMAWRLALVLAAATPLAGSPSVGEAQEERKAEDQEKPPAEGTKEYFDVLKAKYDAETAAIEAAKAALAAKYPADAVTKQTAVVTLTGDALPLAELLALRAGGKLGREIGAKVAGAIDESSRVLVTESSDIATLGADRVWFLQEMVRRKESIETVNKALRKILAQVETPTIGRRPQELFLGVTPSVALVADAAVRGAASILGYFKADFDIKSVSVTAENEILLAAITSTLTERSTRQGWAVPQTSSKPLVDLEALTSALQEVAMVAAELKAQEGKLKDHEKASLTAQIAVLTEHANFVNAAVQRGADGKPSLFQRVLQSEHIFSPHLTHILFAKFVRAGGMAVSRKHLMQMYPRLSFVGVVTVTFTLAEAASGNIKLAGNGYCGWPMMINLKDVGTKNDQFNEFDAEPNCVLMVQ